ncbi:phosphodiester glycosidase family protein [Lactococcus lactis]|uniref:phosphodiester glycosidase family protein n=1 Tax=Lactococcus lactis TaxID=1358 RepID=UPI0011BB00E3|nr:phosphodiester glycosidase family protein [Lactococcus lactis]MCZ8490134.1 phosphodiester glycosidase family protein [Lactococcus lactis]MDG4963416.1 phosphodiester glycosidase family protein [Lactococcus lactis]QEA60340.1 exopolysaccharide biosynthesis protein [Lactococcus lactis]WKG35900.1 phosphodiester glycosidase family protein [Lactococcus lactis subsp. lactis]
MIKKSVAKKIVIVSLIFVLLIALIGFKKYFYDKATDISSANTNTGGQLVKRTSESNGYSFQHSTTKSSKEISQPVAPVENTGTASWLQIVSQGTGEKFTDLSSGDFKIYKAHSPQILKTATSAESPVLSMSEVISKYPNSLIMNASGFNMTTGKINGFQINNGKLFKDWNSDKRATNAFVFNKNGSSDIYNSTTPASDILKKGAEMSFSFGSILIKDGKSLPSDGTVNWEIHSFIGNDKDNNIYLIISDTSTGYQSIMEKFQDLHLENVQVMDGGGSSQMSLNGQIIYPSQDSRSVNDYIILR